MAQQISEYLDAHHGKVTSALPLHPEQPLRFDVASIYAAEVSGDLGRMGFPVRYVTAGFQMSNRARVDIRADGKGGVVTRGVPGKLATTTFEIALPPD